MARVERVVRACLVLSCLPGLVGCGPRVIAPVSLREGTPSLRPVHQATFFQGKLWLAAVQPELWAVDPTSGGAAGWRFDAPVRALLHTRDGRLFVESSPSSHPGPSQGTQTSSLWALEGERWRHVRSWRLPPSARLHALVESGDDVLAVHPTRLQVVSRDGAAREVAIDPPFERAHHASASVAGRWLFVGVNNGEFGGGLWRIDMATGKREEIRGNARNSTSTALDACEVDLSRECTPVTAVIADEAHPGCVLASVGLVHMGASKGGIFRVCDGGGFERVWGERPLGCEGETSQRFECEYGEAAVCDLAAVRGGFVASTTNGVVRFSGDRSQRWRVSEAENLAGLSVSRSVPGLLLLSTRMSSAVSVGGCGPLLVPLREEGPAQRPGEALPRR